MGQGDAPWILNREQKRDSKKQLVMPLVAEEGAWRRWEGAKGRGQLQPLLEAQGKRGRTGGWCLLQCQQRMEAHGEGRSWGMPTAKGTCHMPSWVLALPPLPCSLLQCGEAAGQGCSLPASTTRLTVSAWRASQPCVCLKGERRGTWPKDLLHPLLPTPHSIFRAMKRSLFSCTVPMQNKNNTACSLAGSCKKKIKGLSEQAWIAITLMGCQKSAGSRVRAANPPLVFCPRHCLGSVVAH